MAGIRRTNGAGLALIKGFESCRLTTYRDAVGVLTIGWGHTGSDVKSGRVITQAEADRLLLDDLRRFERGVTAGLGSSHATDNEFSAMVSLAYNIGLGAFKSSSVLLRHKEKRFVDAADAFLFWDKAGGRVLPGLTRRRRAERELYLRP